MEVILRQAVEKLGNPGDVVTVSNGYARNFLLPRGVAFEATEGNKKRIAQEKARLEAAESDRRQTASEFAKVLEEVSITFAARVGEEGKLFGSVTAADIAQQLEAQGHKVERRLRGALRGFGGGELGGLRHVGGHERERGTTSLPGLGRLVPER